MRHRHGIARLLSSSLALLLIACHGLQAKQEETSAIRDQAIAEWRAYGGENAAHYSPLRDINRENVDQLEVAWTHRSGDFADGTGEWAFTSLQVTPLVADNTLYYCTPFGRVFALDPGTGEERWMFDPQVENRRSGLYPAVCRGVSLWSDSQASTNQACEQRIIYGTRDAQLIALDAKTGEPCADFGDNGRVQLRQGVGGEGQYYPTSPPFIINNLAVIGALVPDNERRAAPSGVVRAFDVRSGEMVWDWEPVTPQYRERHQQNNAGGEYLPGTPNVWAPISGDETAGLVYIPTGNPSPDLYGGDRDGSDAYGSSVVALDATTGVLRWHFQTVHHDVWDYDVAAQPGLFAIRGVGAAEQEPPPEGLVQATKMGHIFLLDRHTGEPLYPVEERAVPQDGVAGETLSSTQPFPTHPAPLHLPAQLREQDMHGFTAVDRNACKKELAKYRSDGMFTPPTERGTVLYPSTTGGINWGGVSIDPINGILFTNQMHLASVVQLIPREDYDALNPSPGYPLEYYPMHGSPYGAKRFPLLSPLGAPCNPRPWGSMTAVDLKSGATLWTRPLGTTRDQAPWPLWFEAGSPNMGGSLATAGGLVFIAATTDRYFRAFDTRSGDEIWRHRLPFTGNASPLSYRATRDGKQYVVVASGGHGWSEPGDTLMAFTLPDH